MKNYLIFLFFAILFIPNILFSQNYKLYKTENINNQLRLNTKTGEIYQIQNDGQRFLITKGISPQNNITNRFSLTQTKNMWNFILLDEFNGRLYQVQYSVEGDNYRGVFPINIKSLSSTQKRKFSIQPLTSMFQYYLINNDNGEMWKFQWSTNGDEERWIEKF